MRKSDIIRILGGLLILFAINSTADVIIFTDIDNTMVESRRGDGLSGTFNTPFRLFKILRGSTLQEVEGLPEEIEVSPWDFERIETLLATDNYQAGVGLEEIELSDGQKIKPGYYIVRNPDTYKYFFQNRGRGRGYLVQNLLKTLSGDKRGTWQGKFFPVIQAILNNKKAAQSLAYFSMRGHTEQEWKEFFAVLIKRKFIRHQPNHELSMAVARPEFDRFNIITEPSDRKAAIIEEVIKDLLKRPLKDTDVRLDPSGKDSSWRGHFIIVAEDHQETIRKILAVAKKYIQRGLPIKLAVFNAGRSYEVEAGEGRHLWIPEHERLPERVRPQFLVVGPGGEYREATVEEMFGELLDQKEIKKLKTKGCKGFFQALKGSV